MYTQYSNSYESAKHALEESASQPWFTKFCKAKVLIESLLINPIQRIPRYALLLEDLWKNTPATHPDEPNLKIALLLVKKAADHVNEMLAKEKNFDKLTSEGLLCLLAAHRTLVMDEIFQVLQIDDIKNRKAEKLKTKEYKFFLFNDLLVFMDSVTLKKKEKNEKDYESWPTELMWPKRLPNNIIVIIGPGKHITLNCQSLEAQEWWWHGLTEIIDTQLENTQTHLKDYTWAGSSETLAQRKGTMKWNDGYTYQGWWYRGNMQGAGVLEYLGAVYSGNFEKNVRDGPQGIMQFSNGTVYRGDFKNGKLDGQGELTGLNGDKYVGEWKDGMRTGEGELTYFNGDKYTGEWEGDNLSDTKATLVLLNRTTYVGPFSYGLYHGEGTLTSRVGTFFGDFVYGVKQGKGSMKWSGDIASYEGAWKSGVPHGVGAKEDWMGHYEGDWEKGMRKGKGRMVYKDGSVYEGHWVDDKRHGYGEYECENGYITEYRGEWSKDKKSGKGVMKFAGGSIYDGSMNDDQPHGHGVLTCINPKGEVIIVEGKWVKGIHEGKSTVTLVKGDEKNTFLYDPDDAEFSDFLLPPFFPVISWQDGE